MSDVRSQIVFSILLTLLICVPAAAQSGSEPNPEKLRVISHNVWYGFTQKTEPRYSDWKRWMKAQSPDVVSLQELNTYTEERLQADAQSWDHPYCVLLKEDGFPTGITSRYPITDVKRIRQGFHHGLLRCRIQGIWFYVIHFHPSDFQRRIDEAALLKQDVESLPDENPKVVLAGDFNGFSPADKKQYDSDELLVPFFQGLDQKSRTARNLNDGKLDYGGIQAILDQGYTDLIDSRRSPQLPFVGTFPAALVSDQDHGTDRRLDYLFVSPSLRDQVDSVAILRDPCTEMLSDHIPVTATIRLREPDAKESVFASTPELLQETGAGEGPAWHPRLGLLTSGEGNINQLDLAGRQSVWMRDAGSNGLRFDEQGDLVICQSAQRRLVRRHQDGSLQVLADHFQNMKFNNPNDLAMDAKGRIYFTDPRYGDRSSMEMRDDSGVLVEGVYRVDPDGSIDRIITNEVDRPNGIAISTDNRFLFVADNNNSHGGARKLWRFDLNPDGGIDPATQRLIHDWGSTRGPDGMKLDTAGRLYVAAGLNRPNLPHETADPPTAGIYVFSPAGELLEFVAIPRDETTNCAFGGEDGKTLFVTAGGSLWSIRTTTPGQVF
ncbi:SMP-30/gluconolactonase/LRE family protein [Stieleria varia]|uniref:Gluconolactonase n=1 Tax=Stieleria varia TaxID=2528005 RepID=A0A5C6B7M4_9BACT|nr:SMP-30/gluconolactonase/LRE family protein [Stieleria varia]TWU08073.1 Gluconolactonase precursor [Stieleria varia]